MALGIYSKSLMWLLSCGGAGYILMLLTEPSQSTIEQIKFADSTPVSDEERKKKLFMQKLKEATTDTPVYLQRSKKE